MSPNGTLDLVIVEVQQRRHTGEGWSVYEIEQRLDPAPMYVQEILEWFLDDE
jgi:hypothetical protein